MCHSKVYEQLRDNIYARVDYPEHIKQLMPKAEQAWQNFCKLPREVKQQFNYPNHRDSWRDPGYEATSQDNGKDDKELFHFDGHHDDLIEHYQLQNTLKQYPETQNFFQVCQEIHRELTQWVMELSLDMDQHIPDASQHFLAGKESLTIRFIHYQPKPEVPIGGILGAAHYDGSFTLHLYETQPGLQYLDWDHQWKTLPIDPKETVIFSGYKYHHLSDQEIPKTWHRIIKETNQTDNRISIVLFCELPKIPGYNKHQHAPRHEEPGYD